MNIIVAPRKWGGCTDYGSHSLSGGFSNASLQHGKGECHRRVKIYVAFVVVEWTSLLV